MQVKVTNDRHLTARQKQIIVAGVKNGWEWVQSKKIRCNLVPLENIENGFKAIFHTKESNDWGQMKNCLYSAEVIVC